MKPPNMRMLNVSVSNFDHSVDLDVEDMLRAEPLEVWAEHTAVNFYGRIWFDGEWFREQVMQYCAIVGEFRNKSLVNLLHAVNTRYGWD
jgi:hypothetical protein